MWHLKHSDSKPFDFDGLQIRDYTSGLGQSASVAVIEVPPGIRHRNARSHRSDKYYVSLDGEVSFSVCGKAVLMKPTDVLIVPRLEWFSYVNETNRPSRLLLVHVPAFDLDGEEFAEPV